MELKMLVAIAIMMATFSMAASSNEEPLDMKRLVSIQNVTRSIEGNSLIFDLLKQRQIHGFIIEESQDDSQPLVVEISKKTGEFIKWEKSTVLRRHGANLMEFNQLARLIRIRPQEDSQSDFDFPEIQIIVVSVPLIDHWNVKVDYSSEQKNILDTKKMWKSIDGDFDTYFRPNLHSTLTFELQGVTERLMEIRIFADATSSSREESQIEVEYTENSTKSSHTENSTKSSRTENLTKSSHTENSTKSSRTDLFALRIRLSDSSFESLKAIWNLHRNCFVAKLPEKFQKRFKRFDLLSEEYEFDLKLIQFMVEEKPTLIDPEGDERTVKVLSSTQIGDISSKTMVLDKLGTTNWISDGQTVHEIKFEFSSELQMRYLNMTVSEDPRNVFRQEMRDFSLLFSKDGILWQRRDYYWDNEDIGDTPNTQIFVADFSAKYVKFQVDTSHSAMNSSVMIQWIDFYANPVADKCGEVPRPCHQQGTKGCHVEKTYPICECSVGWDKLKDCGVYNPCAIDNGECLHDSTCTPHTDGERECHCKPGYSGKSCEPAEGECYNNACKNGATCLVGFETATDGKNTKDRKYMCKCEPGFVGQDCQTRIESFCKVEESPSTMVVNATSLGVNEYVLFQCLPGFGIQKPQSDSDFYRFKQVLHCGKSRNIDAPTCKKIPNYCTSKVENIPGMHRGRKSAKIHQEITYHCESGYRFAVEDKDDTTTNEMSTDRECLAKTEQKGKIGETDVEPRCELILDYCTPEVSDGMITSPALKLNEIASYSCESGYTLFGNEHVTCENYSSTQGVLANEPVCEKTVGFCKDNQVSEGMSVDPKQVSIGEMIAFKCNSGYRFADSSDEFEQLIQCESNAETDGAGVLAEERPKCFLVEDFCKISKPSSGEAHFIVTSPSIRLGGNITWKCDAGFILSGHRGHESEIALTCLSSGKNGRHGRFSAEEPRKCHSIRDYCHVTAREGVKPSQYKAKIDQVVEFSCEENYKFMLQERRHLKTVTLKCESKGSTSSESGNWDQREPHCIPIDKDTKIEQPVNISEKTSEVDMTSVNDDQVKPIEDGEESNYNPIPGQMKTFELKKTNGEILRGNFEQFGVHRIDFDYESVGKDSSVTIDGKQLPTQETIVLPKTGNKMAHLSYWIDIPKSSAPGESVLSISETGANSSVQDVTMLVHDDLPRDCLSVFCVDLKAFDVTNDTHQENPDHDHCCGCVISVSAQTKEELDVVFNAHSSNPVKVTIPAGQDGVESTGNARIICQNLPEIKSASVDDMEELPEIRVQYQGKEYRR